MGAEAVMSRTTYTGRRRQAFLLLFDSYTRLEL